MAMAFAIAMLFVSEGVSASEEKAIKRQPAKINAEKIADAIIVGLVSEDGFLKMNLTPSQRVEVFRQIRTKRGWGSSDVDMEHAVYTACSMSKKDGMDTAIIY